MTTPELIEYIKLQSARAIPRAEIKSILVNSGWNPADVEEGLQIVFPVENRTFDPAFPPASINPRPIQTMPATQVNTTKDTYRESVGGAEPLPEFMPTLKPKPVATTPSSEVATSFTPQRATPSTGLNSESLLASYPKDYESLSKMNVVDVPKKRSYALLVTIVLLLLLLGGGGSFLYVKGIFKPAFKVPFLEKEPVVLVEAIPVSLSNVKTFKTDVNIRISFPSVGAVIDGMLGGVSYVPTGKESEKDELVIKSTGTFDLENSKFNLDLGLNNSHLGEEVKTNIVKDGQALFVLVPNLVNLLKENAPIPGFVAMNVGNYEDVISLIPENFSALPEFMQFKNLLVNGLKGEDNSKILSAFNILLKEGTISAVGVEVLHNVNTKHLHIKLEKDKVSTFLQVFADVLFGQENTDTIKVKRENFAKDVDIESVDLWLGEDDNLPYKYTFVVSMPMDRVVGNIDQNVDTKIVSFDIQIEQYDFNSAVNITSPENAMPVKNYTDMLHSTFLDTKVRNYLDSFLLNSRLFYEANGKTFGKKSNTSGSCVTPTPGSLFSTIGHKQTASEAIIPAQENLTNILAVTSGRGLCYSTSQSWAIAVPTATDVTKMYCLDSKGRNGVLDKLIKGASCE